MYRSASSEEFEIQFVIQTQNANGISRVHNVRCGSNVSASGSSRHSRTIQTTATNDDTAHATPNAITAAIASERHAIIKTRLTAANRIVFENCKYETIRLARRAVKKQVMKLNTINVAN